jgi:hypothetical protein
LEYDLWPLAAVLITSYTANYTIDTSGAWSSFSSSALIIDDLILLFLKNTRGKCVGACVPTWRIFVGGVESSG